MTRNPSYLQAIDVSKRVRGPDGELALLTDINLSVDRGEAVAVVGVSGAGKSTLLGLLAGLDTPSGGRILLDGIRLDTLDEDARARTRLQRVGFVFQSFQLLPALTALENVMLPLELAGERAARERARATLAEVGLDARLKHYPHQLSGGEQQRVALARAFAPRPALLFADEPTGNLDERTAETVAALLFELNRAHQTTLVLVTHEAVLARHCHRRLRLEGGRLMSG